MINLKEDEIQLKVESFLCLPRNTQGVYSCQRVIAVLIFEKKLHFVQVPNITVEE